MINLKNALLWRKSIDAISSFASEGNIRFSDRGIFFKGTDPSQVVLVDYGIEKKKFDKYSVEPSFVGLDLTEMSRIMARSQSNDSLQLDLTDSELIVGLKGEISRKFKLPLLDLAEDEVKVPDVNFDATITMKARILKEALKDSSLFASSVVFKVSKSSLLIEAMGISGSLTETISNTKNIKVNSKKEVVSKYSLGFLQNIVKEANSDVQITLELKSDAPMKVTYEIMGNKITYFLAHMLL